MEQASTAECELCCYSSRRRQGPDLIYVIGSGRSGSTLLERILASAPGVAAVGEIHALWRLPLTELRCACGSLVADCSFWTKALTRADIGAAELGRLARLERSVVRNRHLWRLGYDLRRIREDPQIVEFSAMQGRIFHAIRQVAGVSVVIDSSKAGPRGWILAASLAPLILHSRRGAEEVMTSWRRTKPDPGSGRLMPRPPIGRAGWDWIKAEQAARSLAGRTPLRRVDHAAFCTAPRDTLRAALDGHCEDLVDRIQWVGPDRVTPRPGYHSVLGNPDRFAPGDIVIRPPMPGGHPRGPGLEPRMIRALGGALSRVYG